ncbi:phage tail protein [Pseudomonas urmiensis]|uniref:phage tail protein n=1 Tax=Pseudomonas urmiensis TaxID=2745493 RepID=UPI003C9F5039
MKRLYSMSTGMCYLVGIHTAIPADALEISEECFISVIGNPEPGKIRSHDEHGLPILIDPPPLTLEQKAEHERQWRDAELATRQWLRDRHRDEQDLQRETTLTGEQFAELLAYLQDLRDWPQSELFPALEDRPIAPPWIADQTQ